MKLNLFADGISNVVVGNGVVRIDFFVSRPDQSLPSMPGQTSLAQDNYLSVNLPLPTFIQSMNVLQSLMGQLISDGVVSTKESQIIQSCLSG